MYSKQELALHLGFPHGSVRYYSFDNDVNGLLLLADVVLHASFQDEQNFPSLLMRAMSFGIPIIAPDLPIMKKYVSFSMLKMLFSFILKLLFIETLYLFYKLSSLSFGRLLIRTMV